MDVRDTYLAAWNETDRETRDALLSSTWAPGATYVDPLARVAGVDEISDLIENVHRQFPGLVFSPVGDVDAHHDVVRFQWGLGVPGEEPAVVGFDVVRTEGDRIRSVAGFIDTMPA